MKKVLVAVMTVVAAVSVSAQSRAIDKHADMTAEGRPFFTDGGLYNSYDLAGSPLGRFEFDSTRLDVDLGYRYFGLGDESASYLSGQTLRMGEPGKAFFEVFYGPDFLLNKNSANAASGAAASGAASLPLQRFGFAVAGQTASGFFRGSLAAEAYTGAQEWENGDSARVFWGLERLRLDMGSQPHPLVRVGFYVGAKALMDTLNGPFSPEQRRDLSIQMNIVEFGGDADFGGEDMPVRSNLSLAFSPSRMVYAYRGLGEQSNSPPPAMDRNRHAPAIVNDSVHLFWLAQGRIPIVEDEYVVKPGLLLGWSNNSAKMYNTDEDNSPFSLGNVIDNLKYDLSGFYFGIGSGFELLKYADLHAEYSLASMSLKLGNSYPQTSTKSRMLHHTAIGVATSIQKYINLPLDISPRIAYFISGSAGIVPAVYPDLFPLNTVSGKSKTYLYSPQLFLEGFARTSGFTVGVDGSALENKLSVSYWMTFLSRKAGDQAMGGIELGLSAGFSL
jgi:hypothetical protein